MQHTQTKGNVLIYSLVLVNLALLLALAMFNNFFVFINNTEGSNIDKRLSNNILEKWALFAKYTRTLNSNGNGIVDAIGCPSTVTLSWSSVASPSVPELVNYNWGLYCWWTHNGTGYYIYFNPEFTAFSGAIYYGDAINLSAAWIWARPFVDYDATTIDISGGIPTLADGFDDDFNSDNYRISGSGTTMFPWWYIDDDAVARTSVYGYISPQSEYSSIFWSNDRVQTYIEGNANNADSYYERLWDVSTWVLYLDVDRNYDMKILQFDRTRYNSTKELIVNDVIETTDIEASIWYIQNNAWVLSLSPDITGNEYIFDFTANDYAVFLDNTGSWVLTYVMTGESSSWSWIYLNPIDDSGAGSIKYLWAEIIQDAEKNYIGKIFEVTNKK